MKKIRVTNKQIKEGYSKILSIGYCNACYLLNGLEPRFYTCGTLGWNADIYEYNYNIAIATGYRPCGNISPDYEKVHTYNEKARKIWNNTKYSYKVKQNKSNKLLDQFISEVLEND